MRDELNKLAASEGRTIDGMVSTLIDDYRWRLEVEKTKRTEDHPEA